MCVAHTGIVVNKLNQSIGSLMFLVVATTASGTTLSGNLGDSGNTALVGSDLGVPDFTDANAVANNVALYTFTTNGNGPVTLVSTGFAAGGIDPYFSIFSGTGSSATFLDSNYIQAFSTGGDFSYSAALGAGTYEVAIGAFANMSFAENSPDLGTVLGGGFVGLGDPNALHDGSYVVSLTTPVPEPGAAALFLFGLAALAVRKSRRTGAKGEL
jgi:hypothetical protein